MQSFWVHWPINRLCGRCSGAKVVGAGGGSGGNSGGAASRSTNKTYGASSSPKAPKSSAYSPKPAAVYAPKPASVAVPASAPVASYKTNVAKSTFTKADDIGNRGLAGPTYGVQVFCVCLCV